MAENNFLTNELKNEFDFQTFSFLPRKRISNTGIKSFKTLSEKRKMLKIQKVKFIAAFLPILFAVLVIVEGRGVTLDIKIG